MPRSLTDTRVEDLTWCHNHPPDHASICADILREQTPATQLELSQQPKSTVQKRFTNLILVLVFISASAAATMAETPHTVPVMGVSSAWTGGDLNNHNTGIPEVSHRAAVTGDSERTFQKNQNKSLVTSKKLKNEKASSAAQTKPEPVLFNDKLMEQVLDSWQLSIKHFIADANPRLTAFIKMASAKLGLPRAGSTKSQMACPPPAEIRMHLQPLSNHHSAWLMSDGRLKTVTAH